MNSENQLLARIELLEKQFKESQKKDSWDKALVLIQALGSVLIPVVIILATHLLSKDFEEAQKKSSEKIADATIVQADAIKIQAKVDQAMALKDLIELLTDSDSSRRQLAVKSVNIALKDEDAKAILTVVQKIDPSPSVKNAAQSSLDSVYQSMHENAFQKLFSTGRSDRSQALTMLRKKGWKQSLESDRQLIDFAIQNALSQTEMYSTTYATQPGVYDLGIVNTLTIFEDSASAQGSMAIDFACSSSSRRKNLDSFLNKVLKTSSNLTVRRLVQQLQSQLKNSACRS